MQAITGRPFSPFHRPPGHGSAANPVTDIRVTDRDQSLPGRRGHQLQFCSPNTIVSVTNGSAARATQSAALPQVVPPNAIGVIVITNILSNTVTSGVYTVLLHTDPNNSGQAQAIFWHKKGMDNTAYSSSQQGIAPIVNGQIVYQTTISGTVNVNFQIMLVGWILS